MNQWLKSGNKINLRCMHCYYVVLKHTFFLVQRSEGYFILVLWIPESYDERKIPEVINKLRQSKQNLLRESKIAELTKNFNLKNMHFLD